MSPAEPMGGAGDRKPKPNAGAGVPSGPAGRPPSPTMFAPGGLAIGDSKVSQVKPFDLQPTEDITMSRKKFLSFVSVIKAEGIKEPIHFVEHEGKKYVVDGHHRLRASKLLGLSHVPIMKVELPYKGYSDIRDLTGYCGL